MRITRASGLNNLHAVKAEVAANLYLKQPPKPPTAATVKRLILQQQ